MLCAIDDEWQEPQLRLLKPKAIHDQLVVRANHATPRITIDTVGRFFSLVYYGRIFQFDPETKAAMLSVYENAIEREAALEIYVKSCLWRIWERFKFEPGVANLVAEGILGNGVVNQARLLLREPSGTCVL